MSLVPLMEKPHHQKALKLFLLILGGHQNKKTPEPNGKGEHEFILTKEPNSKKAPLLKARPLDE